MPERIKNIYDVDEQVIDAAKNLVAAIEEHEEKSVGCKSDAPIENIVVKAEYDGDGVLSKTIELEYSPALDEDTSMVEPTEVM